MNRVSSRSHQMNRGARRHATRKGGRETEMADRISGRPPKEFYPAGFEALRIGGSSAYGFKAAAGMVIVPKSLTPALIGNSSKFFLSSVALPSIRTSLIAESAAS